MSRRLIVYVAVSTDGFIARADGGIDWLDRPEPKDGYGMGEFVASIDTILWGRKTYDWAVQMDGIGGPDGFAGMARNYVFSTNPPAEPQPGVEFVREPLADFVRALKETPGKDVWVMGGAGLIASLLDAGLVDEFHLHVIPVLIGEGIPLAAAARRNVNLRLLDAVNFADGVVRLRYAVLAAPSSC